MKEYPEWATWIGRTEGQDRWRDISLEAIARRKRIDNCRLEALKKISRKELKGTDLVNYDLLLDRAQREVAQQAFEGDYLVMDHLDGLHTDLPATLTIMRAATKKDVENMLSRLAKVPQLAQQTEVLLREGMKRKITPVKMFLERVPGQFEKILNTPIAESPIYKPFRELSSTTINEQDRIALQRRAREVIQNDVHPALVKLRDFVVKEYIPAARETISWKEMPNGPAWYNHLVKSHTTTDMTAAELHDLGLKEVSRITVAMNQIREQVKFKGDLKAFNKHLLTHKQFYFTKEEDLLTGYRELAKRIDPELPKLFKTLPRTPYGIRAIPAYKAKETSAAYYTSGSLEGGRPGWFEANTHDLRSRPKWGMEALTLHEAVPGHHLQIALAKEIGDLPEFRKHSGYTVFSEGWALYAESLGEELGFYKDPYSKYGQLSYEMWRAVRLVVDTGIHFHGWSREKAIEYMMAQMPKSRAESEVEIDRYITWPGQALSYKVGQLKIRELRDRATAKLGEKFDLREFHDQVLKNGPLPLEVLEKNIDSWIASANRAKSTESLAL